MGLVVWTITDTAPGTLVNPNTSTAVDPDEVTANFSKAVDTLYQEATSNFNKGYQAEMRQDYPGAVDLYRIALTETNSPSESAHIKFRLARALEYVDTPAAIRTFKEIVADPTYPDTQKKYALMWLPMIILRTIDDNPLILEEALVGEPYSSFRETEVNDTLNNFYEYTITFGSTGIAEFAIAQSLAEAVRDGKITDQIEQDNTKKRITELMAKGKDYTEGARTDSRNSALLPRIYRAQAKANAVAAQLGDPEALQSFDTLFLEAINQGLATKLDGAVRWDYFRYAYDTFGESSFEKTQSHLDVLLNNLNEYTGIRNYLVAEKNNGYGAKNDVVKYANANATLKAKLLELGWTAADF